MAHDEQDSVDGWHTYSIWIDELRNGNQLISKLDDDSSFKQQLLSCGSNLSRFALLWHNDKLRDEIERIYRADLESCKRKRRERVGKSVEESTRMRELGNKSFKNGNFMDALNQYTQAVRFAPYPSQAGCAQDAATCLALALANRSAALYSLTRYRLCLLDIDLAIKYGYPDGNMFKLLIRKVKCLHILSVWANDVEQIKENLKSMLKSRDTKEFVRAEINNMFEFLEQTQPEDMEKDELDVVDETTMKISNISKSLTQAADCVEMSYDSDKGRYLMTNKDVSFGRLLIAEEPYVCNLAPHKRDQYCYNCFGRLHSCGLGCSKCTQVLFCSEECLNAKADTHAHECNSFLDFQEKLGVAYLPSHMMFKINFNLSLIPIYSRKNVDKKPLEDVLKIHSSDWPDLVYKNEYASVLSLMDHSENYDYDELMGYTLTASYLMIAILDQFSCSNEKLTEKQTQLVMGSILLRHLLQLQTNLISILDQNLQELASVGHSLTEMQERPIGVGIYPTISLLNHSCNPNILSIFHRNRFIARAGSSLECGTEINYCYGPSMSRMSKKDRQRRLKEQYFFTCACESCTYNRENESRALLCPDCQGPVIYNQDLTHECMKCHAEGIIDAGTYLKRVGELKIHLDQLRESEKDFVQKLSELKSIENSLKKLLYWRHPLFVQIKSELIECAEGLEDLDLALRYCEEELDLSEKTFGKDSYESIMTKLKLINIKWQNLYYSVEESSTDESRKKGTDGLRLLLTMVGETRGKLKDLLASTNILGAESSFETELKFLGDIQSSINQYLESLQQTTTEPELAPITST